VNRAIGLTTATASASYIQLYHGNAALLTESLELVQQTAAVILSTLKAEEPVSQEVPETTAESAPEPKRARRSRAQTEITSTQDATEAIAEVA